MESPKLKAWQLVRERILSINSRANIPAVPTSSESSWARKEAWRRTSEWAYENGAGDVIDGLNEDDYCKAATFSSSLVSAENYGGAIGLLLNEVEKEPTWTKRKRAAVKALLNTLAAQGYAPINGHGVRYRVSHIGGSFIYRVPATQQGHLRPFRGQTVRVVCVGSGSRSYRTYMIGAAGSG